MEWIELGELAEIQTGKLNANAAVKNGKYPFFTCADEISYIDKYDYDKECILVAGNGNLNVKYYHGKFNAYQRTYIIESKNTEKLNTMFLYYFMNTYMDKLRDLSIGGVIKYIKLGNLTEAKIPVPSMKIQKQIVEVLDKAQKLIDNRKEQIGLLDDLIESLLIYEVGPMSKRYDEWKEMQIKDVVLKNKGSMRTGPFGSDLLHSEFVSEGIYVLGIDNVVENRFTWGKERYITEEKYEKLKRYTVYPEDVLISIMGTTGRSAVVPKEIELAINTKHLACLTLNRDLINPYFLSLSIHLNPTILTQIRLRNKGAIMNGLNLTIIKELKIKVPPIQLQNQFAEKVELIERQKSLLQQSLKLLEDNYNNLMQRVFKGELF